MNETRTGGGRDAAVMTRRPARAPADAMPMPPQMPRLVQRAHSRSCAGHSIASDTTVTTLPTATEAATTVHAHGGGGGGGAVGGRHALSRT